MVKVSKLPSSSKYNKSRSVQFGSETLINFYAETDPEKGVHLYGRPALKLFSNVSSNPVYALHSWQGNIYSIIGDNLYKIDENGGYMDLGSIGTVTQPIQIFDNPVELIILNNQNGSTFTYDLTNGLRQVDDANFRNPSSGTFLDGYAIFSERDKDVFFISDIDDARTYDILDFASAEASSDKIIRVYATLKYLWCFGERTIEVFQNTGASDFPFRNVAGLNFQQGCGAMLSVAQIKNIMMWLGEDRTIWAYLGQPRKISTPAIDTKIKSFDRIDNAFAFAFNEEGHDFYCITFPNNGTFVYDLSEEKWYEWKTFEENYWAVNSYTFAFGKNFVGDANTGKIYCLDNSIYEDGSLPVVSEFITPNLFNDSNYVFIDRLEARWEAGFALKEGQGSEPQVMLQKSNDGGMTWSKEIWRPISKRGEYGISQCIWHNLGSGKNVCFKIKISDPVKRNLQGLYGVIRGGEV